MAKGGARVNAGRKPGVPNKITADIKALAQQYGAEAVDTLVEIMRKPGNDTTRVAASKELIDRGYGKAIQSVALGGSAELIHKVVYEIVDPQS